MELLFYIYILKCSDGSYYAGQTDDIYARLMLHSSTSPKESGAYSYVAQRMPWKLVFLDGFGTREEACLAEKRIKGWNRKKKEALIEGGWEAVVGMWREQKK